MIIKRFSTLFHIFNILKNMNSCLLRKCPTINCSQMHLRCFHFFILFHYLSLVFSSYSRALSFSSLFSPLFLSSLSNACAWVGERSGQSKVQRVETKGSTAPEILKQWRLNNRLLLQISAGNRKYSRNEEFSVNV